MLIVYICIILGAIVCAILAIRADHLLTSSLWLAALSALLAVFFYVMGAQQIAVIELSIGAGLVTVLFVFAIALVGPEATGRSSQVPRALALFLALSVLCLLGWFSWPLWKNKASLVEPSFTDLLWEGRAVDILVQVFIIFASVLGILGLLVDLEKRNVQRDGIPTKEGKPIQASNEPKEMRS